ncbi:DUF4185 domain-containing protein, partial [Streptomyces doebereineriae]
GRLVSVTKEAVDRVGGRYSVEVRRKALHRMNSAEAVAAIAADTGISRSTLSRWKSATNGRRSRAQTAARRGVKLADVTGVGITDRWGVTATDLGASVLAPNGTLVSVFGDAFSGVHVGEGLWRAPVALIGSGDAQHPIHYERAGGSDPNFAQQLWFYIHDDPSTGWSRGGISTVLPSDLLR